MKTHHYLAETIYLRGAWTHNVLLTVDPQGCWQVIDTAPSAAAKAAAQRLSSPVIPSLVNAHSHAFQRAFAGMAESRIGDADHFWSWRDRMYAVANRVTPAHMQAIAAQLYLEMLQGGYTQVCEFHYLHRDAQGNHYADPYAMSHALIAAAQQVGIGLTLLPVLYERAGFASADLRADQRRFRSDSAWVAGLCQQINTQKIPSINAGVAIHSLRAAQPSSIQALQALLANDDVPIHIHVSEQMAEVTECEAVLGHRPVAWLAQEKLLDARWQLVHATHTTAAEIEAVAANRAGVVICPSTEANLGDGFTDAVHWLNAGVGFTVGSDSHVSRSWREELRWLEYGQRLRLQQRNVLASPATQQNATAARLFKAAQHGGAAAAGLPATGFEMGARADFLLLDAAAPALLGVPTDLTLDALVFASDTAAVSHVYVGGECVLQAGQHPQQGRIAADFVQVMGVLWGNPVG